ncbi:related endopolygalacturonase C [Phialocephala subalpina]|uniref:endo-polygalacturonase n=1 Tax=Phialocephala subalpina TaxID=576137 RepID=A0A1L7WQ99_9HELO|nr:related endopolygalacturonase C [Phialocephala subalpina]
MLLPSVTIFAALLASAMVLGSPVTAPEPTPPPSLKDAVVRRDTTCTFSGSSGYSLASKSKTSCSTIVLSSLTVPSGVTLNLEKLNDGTNVIFQGTTTWGYEEWEGPLFSVSGNQIAVKGDPGSVLDGQGALWWDGLGGGGGKIKPKLFKANDLTDSILEGITIRNAPKNSFSINRVTRLTVKDITIDDSAGTSKGKNTDGFNINNSDQVYFTGVKVWNQDDCMNVNSGTNIYWTNGFCSGGHGLSIGSVANGSVVRNVTFENTVTEKQQQSVRIKTVSGAVASVSDIFYRGITINGGTDYGILVDQSYGGTKHQPTNGVTITNFQLSNVTGYVDSGATQILIECGSGSCSNWSWSNVKVTGGEQSTACLNTPSGISC